MHSLTLYTIQHKVVGYLTKSECCFGPTDLNLPAICSDKLPHPWLTHASLPVTIVTHSLTFLLLCVLVSVCVCGVLVSVC